MRTTYFNADYFVVQKKFCPDIWVLFNSTEILGNKELWDEWKNNIKPNTDNLIANNYSRYNWIVASAFEYFTF